MAMLINNNSSAQMALGEMRKNNSKLDKAARQAASGVKIGGAGDGASEYSISEKMRVQIRGLEQDIANAQTGTNLIKTAEGGIQNIIDNLRSLKELALNAANDHNTDLDRETIQKEVDSRLATIDDIAATTNYNGKLLLNGDYGIAKAAKEPKGTTILITAGTYDYNITQDGVYSIASGYHGHINISASNVKLVQQTPGDQLTAIAIKTSSGGGTTLWLDGIHIDNASTAASDALYTNGACNIIQFQGAGNTLNIKNDVKLVAGNFGTDWASTIQSNREKSAGINMGDGLSINGVGINSSLTVNLNDTGSGLDCYAAAIGTDRNQSTSGNLTIKNLNNISAYCEFGTDIGAGSGGSIGSINIENVDCIQVKTRAAGVGIGAHSQAGCSSIDISAGIIYGGNWNSDSGGSIIRGNSVSVDTRYMLLATKPATANVGNFQNGYGGGTTIDANTAVINGQAYVPTDTTYSPYQNSQVYEANNPSYTYNEKEEDGPPVNDLIIHTGTKANQHLLVIINSMDTDSLGIQPLPVNPREAAVAAISAIDGAIDYSLNENTRMGAYQSRLSYTIDNLVTASENTQSSESVIRDADMAKAMMEHAKYNILSQSSQAMLAQANQISSGILSLLQ